MYTLAICNILYVSKEYMQSRYLKSTYPSGPSTSSWPESLYHRQPQGRRVNTVDNLKELIPLLTSRTDGYTVDNLKDGVVIAYIPFGTDRGYNTTNNLKDILRIIASKTSRTD